MPRIIKLNKTNKDLYLDSSEAFLTKFFNKPEKEKSDDIRKELAELNTPWPVRYQLSPQRHMLLNWYPFKKSSNLLEIGAGCGGVTGVFIDKVKTLDCNELSPSRANVIFNRFQNSKNLTIYLGNANEIESTKKYDYVTLIGVLEYSGKYSKSPQPHLELLKTAKRLLKKNGHLLLAIENKLGLKYLSGAPEDHTETVFDSLENYPQNNGIRTFSKKELIGLLKSAGFNKTEFYYPFPDYKLPQIVFSEQGISIMGNLTKSSITQTVDYSQGFDRLYNEVSLSYSFHKEELMGEFANSFLVDAYD